MKDGADVRERMLRAALHLFADQGYGNTSVEQIVTRAGVTKGAFYYYFKAKEEVLELIHNQFLDYEITMAERVAASEGTAVDKLRAMISDLINSIVLYRLNVVVFFQEVDRLPPERRAEIERRRRIYQEQIEEIVREGVRRGEFNPHLDPVITTLGIFGLCNYTYRWLNPAGRLSVDEVVSHLTEMIVRGLACPQVPTAP